jgi:GntR family transcriptional regulator
MKAAHVTLSPLVAFLQRALEGHMDGPAVIYRDLANALRRAIAEGVVGHGTLLPSERDLGEQVGVSRTSVRKAMDSMVDDGVLIRRQGARTAVAERVEKPLSSLTSFTEDMRSRGLEPGMLWLSRGTGVASPAETMALDLSVGQQVSRLRRLRTSNGKPMAIENAVVPVCFLPDPDEVTSSLYEVLSLRGCRPARALQRLRAAVANAEDAKLLGLEVGAPLLVAERRCFARDGRPVEFTQTRYCGDRYDFIAELRLADPN